MRHASQSRRPLHFVGSSLKDLRGMPEDVQDVFGSALLDAQHGDQPEAAYVASLPGAVHVLHAFKKKSTSGIGTPRPDKELIRARLRAAEAHHRDTYEKG